MWWCVMSITQKETSEYVAKYYFDRYGLIISGDEVFNKYPWHEIVWEKFFAYAFHKIKGYYESWEDVPQPYYEGMLVNIISIKLLERYEYRKGRWYDLGSCTASCWKP